MAPSGSEVVDDRIGFEIDWLEDCYKKVSFPNPKCERFLVEFNERLSNKVRGELENEVKQQALFSLLGEEYVRLHFPHHKYDPKLLEPPRTRPEVRDGYLKEMKSLLEEQMTSAQKDMGIPEDLSEYEGNDELGDFLDEIKVVFRNEMERQCRLKVEEQQFKQLEQDAKNNDQGQTRAKSHKRPRTKDKQRKKEGISEEVIEEKDEEEQDENNEEDGKKKQRRSHIQSQVPAEAVVATAKLNLTSKQTAFEKFKQANLMLPEAIRRFFWIDFIYRNDKSQNYGEGDGGKDRDGRKRSRREKRKDLKPIDVDSIRRQFRHDVNKKIDLKKIHRAVQSSDYKKIYSVIIDSYHTTKVLKPLAEDFSMLQAAHVINVVNVLNKSYSNAQIFLLAPLQMVFPQGEEETDEKAICRLGNDLNLLWNKTHLSWDDVFQVALEVMDELEIADPSYFEHLVKTIKERTAPVDVYDFAYEILDGDPKKSIRLWNDLYKKKKRDWKDRDLESFSNPEIYIRKWVSEAFAGVLGDKLLLYAWDLLFLNRWSKQIFKRICLALLFLIKPWALKADSNRKLSKVLLEEPGKIYIGDFRKALSLIIEEKPLTEIQSTNCVDDDAGPNETGEGSENPEPGETDASIAAAENGPEDVENKEQAEKPEEEEKENGNENEKASQEEEEKQLVAKTEQEPKPVKKKYKLSTLIKEQKKKAKEEEGGAQGSEESAAVDNGENQEQEESAKDGEVSEKPEKEKEEENKEEQEEVKEKAEKKEIVDEGKENKEVKENEESKDKEGKDESEKKEKKRKKKEKDKDNKDEDKKEGEGEKKSKDKKKDKESKSKKEKSDTKKEGEDQGGEGGKEKEKKPKKEGSKKSEKKK